MLITITSFTEKCKYSSAPSPLALSKLFALMLVMLYHVIMKRKLALIMAVVLSMAAATTTPVLADDTGGHTCGSTSTFFEWNCGSDDKSIILDVLTNILNWAAIGVSVAVAIGIIYGGLMVGSSGGNEAQMKKGLEIIRNAVIALVLYFAMYAILNYLIPGGLFG